MNKKRRVSRWIVGICLIVVVLLLRLAYAVNVPHYGEGPTISPQEAAAYREKMDYHNGAPKDPEFDEVTWADSAERVVELLGEPDKVTSFDWDLELWSFESSDVGEILLSPGKREDGRETQQYCTLFRIDDAVYPMGMAMEDSLEFGSLEMGTIFYSRMMSSITAQYGEPISKEPYPNTENWYYFESISDEDAYVRRLTIDTGKNSVVRKARIFGAMGHAVYQREIESD